LQKKKKKEKKEKLAKKKKRKNTVDYCCNPQCFVCGGTMNPPHGIVICIIALFVMTYNCNSQTTQYSKNKIKKDNLKKIIKKTIWEKTL
jgi:DNA/RNA endonuclease G (NUC1)